MLLELLIIGTVSYLWQRSQVTTHSSTPAPTRPRATPPERVICLVGRTGAGKSSTANALVGGEVFPSGAEHGTTREVRQCDFQSGYKLCDTPGLLDDTDYSDCVWAAIRRSELVIFTTTGQLYQQERQLLERIRSRQQEWDSEAGCPGQRTMAVYVNQEDIKQLSMTRAARAREMTLVREQVAPWLPADRVVSGTSAPVLHGVRQSPRIDDIRSLVLSHVAGSSN